ncbi:alpha 1:2 mannosidase precursor-like protein [Leptotrombidium deliense]|uniref:alpha-1,2-Mannosidase n=1 Tax=Leptotrombidium deliense TaxID=299467 RepID=A0A443SUS5_9ACAR|nr:alpha 1:2 mannosidase precursor-like protein [Leptotrombidium deliense]
MVASVLRLREKYILILITSSFVVFCIGGFFFLPELKAGTQFAFKQIKDAGPDLLGLIPPVEENKALHVHQSVPLRPPEVHPGWNPRFPAPVTARGKMSDQQKLAEKIRNEMMNINLTQLGAVLPRPFPLDIENDSGNSGSESEHWPLLRPSQPKDEVLDKDVRSKRDTVREMMKHAWSNYVKYAWGHNELKPISRKGHSAGIFGNTQLGATIVDALDTLYIMGLKDEFNAGRKWIAENLDFSDISADVSVFETNIRFIGGLLSCYALTNDALFLEKSEHIAKKLLPAFNTLTGIPYSIINPKTGFAKNYVWASSGSSILSEIGTMHLEFVYLSDLTNNPVYKEKVLKVRNILQKTPTINGLYPNYINPKTGRWGQRHISMGALGDSFYEYLLKAWIQSGGEDQDAKDMYFKAIDAVKNKLLQRSKNGLYYLADMKYDRLDHKMDHLTCFAGGLFALGAQDLWGKDKEEDLNIGAELTRTCRESYKQTETGLGPESFKFTENIEAKAMKQSERYYIQRPETVESYFYLWRFTKEQKYRDWAWDVVQALQKHCRVENGFTGLKNVYDANGPKDDVQQSFFLAETLKYLYLIFSEDDLIGFDKWVFNTEAHPLPIKGHNPVYPKSTHETNFKLDRY